MDAMGDESCSRCQQFLRHETSGLVEVIDVMGRWHLDYGAVTRKTAVGENEDR